MDILGLVLLEAVDVHLLSEKVVFWLANVHPVAWQLKLIQLFVTGHGWEHFSLDRGWLQRNALKNVCIKQVHAGIDLIGDEGLWLLHEPFDLAILVCHDHAIAAGLVDSRDNECALAAMALVELHHLGERVVTNNVSVKHEEQTLGVVCEQFLLCQTKWPCRTKGL